MRASFCIADSDFGDAFYRRWGVDGAIFVQHSAVPVIGIFAQTYITRDVERREKGSQFFNCEDDRTVFVVCESASAVLDTNKQQKDKR